MAGAGQEGEDSYSEAETVQRRQAALKRMLATPPKPHQAKIAKAAKPDKTGPG